MGITGSTDGVLRYDLQGDSIAQAMSSAAEEPSMADCISAATNSTLDLDRAESLAIKKVFKERTREISFSSLKSMIGEFDGSRGIRSCRAVRSALLNGCSDGKSNISLWFKRHG